MTYLAPWSYRGTVPLTGDLSILESALHSGRVAAAELGYTAEPQTIETTEAMWLRPDGDPETELLTADQALASGLEFSPTVLRFRMEWASEGEADKDVSVTGPRDGDLDAAGQPG